MTPAIPDLHPYLTAAYSGDELATLCADYFRDVYENFAAGMTKAQKILLLLDYCQRRELLLNLVAALERDRPEQYQRHFGADGGDRPTRTRPQRSPRQVFVSHAHQDAEFAHRLAADLQQRGWQAWIAPASIRLGEKWVEAINRGLAESSVFVVVLTPAAVDSPWVTDETNAAIMLTNKGKMRFIPAEVASCDAPPLWELYQWIPFTVRYADGLSALLATLGQGAVAPPCTPDPVRAGVPHPVAMPSLEPGRGDPAPTAAPPCVPDPMPPVLPEITDYQTDHVGARSPRPASMLGYKQILCPNCLTEIRYRKEVSKCANPKCAKELPAQYIQNYERAAPFFVQLIGWSAVGKTVYLQALTLMLMQMGKIWRNYSFSPLTEQTLGYVQGVREFLSKGTMPPPTQLALQEACIMLLLGMSRWDGRMLVSRDVAGEVFNKLQFPIEYTPYLLHVPTTFLMISLYDLEEFPEKSMDQLMTSFIETMGKYDPNFRKKTAQASRRPQQGGQNFRQTAAQSPGVPADRSVPGGTQLTAAGPAFQHQRHAALHGEPGAGQPGDPGLDH